MGAVYTREWPREGNQEQVGLLCPPQSPTVCTETHCAHVGTLGLFLISLESAVGSKKAHSTETSLL